MRMALLIGALLRVGVAFWNGFFGPSFGADLDAQGLHGFAVAVSQDLEWEEFSIGYVPYTNLLGAIYYLTSSSLFLGGVLSCIAWWGSAVALTKCMRMIGAPKRDQVRALWIYALLPTSVLLTSVTLREPYQLLFVNIAVYAVLKIYLERSVWHWGILLFGVVGMGALHAALLAGGAFIVVSALIMMAVRGRPRIARGRLLLVVPLVLFVAAYSVELFSSLSYKLEDGLDVAIQTYQDNLLGIDARTSYASRAPISGLVGLVLFIPSALFQYLFEPMPWHVSSIADIELIGENFLRVWLIIKALAALKAAQGEQYRVTLFVFVSYVLIEMVWAVGTTNWGTAVRHHIPTMGLLLVVAFSGMESGPRRVENRRVKSAKAVV